MEEDIQNYLPTVMFRGTCPVSKDVIVSTKNFLTHLKKEIMIVKTSLFGVKGKPEDDGILGMESDIYVH